MQDVVPMSDVSMATRATERPKGEERHRHTGMPGKSADDGSPTLSPVRGPSLPVRFGGRFSVVEASFMGTTRDGRRCEPVGDGRESLVKQAVAGGRRCRMPRSDGRGGPMRWQVPTVQGDGRCCEVLTGIGSGWRWQGRLGQRSDGRTPDYVLLTRRWQGWRAFPTRRWQDHASDGRQRGTMQRGKRWQGSRYHVERQAVAGTQHREVAKRDGRNGVSGDGRRYRLAMAG